jgi:hypothetical protein
MPVDDGVGRIQNPVSWNLGRRLTSNKRLVNTASRLVL